MSGRSVEEVREGFLCPMCLKDLGDISQLQVHVADAHRSPEERDVVFQIKGSAIFLFACLFFQFRLCNVASIHERLHGTPLRDVGQGQAEDSKLQPGRSLGGGGGRNGGGGGFHSPRPPLPRASGMGLMVSHTEYFRKIRDARIDQVAVETNMLIIRLDKLINHSPNDPSKRKGDFMPSLPTFFTMRGLPLANCSEPVSKNVGRQSGLPNYNVGNFILSRDPACLPTLYVGNPAFLPTFLWTHFPAVHEE